MNFFDILKNFPLLSKEKLFGNCYLIDDAGVLNGSITLVRSVYAPKKDLQFSSKNHYNSCLFGNVIDTVYILGQ